MADVRGWIEQKLLENGYYSTRHPGGYLEIERTSRPGARVLCVGLGGGEKFDAEDVDRAVSDLASSRFIVVLPTRITHAAYERAEERRVCVAGFGELLDALINDENIEDHVDSQEQYERRRLGRHSAVKSIKRRGHHAYDIRRDTLRTLTIITTNGYEFTADELYSLLESYEDITPDVIVVTNPNCHGFSTDSLRAAAQVGVPLALFDDFLGGLALKWN